MTAKTEAKAYHRDAFAIFWDPKIKKWLVWVNRTKRKSSAVKSKKVQD